ncbi:CsbD family protein [Streptomyces sp. NPDC058398]|uniref:CsbD family protein n=1 Tax=Streptomyces sp. NPDC058398 TaxID=3346479 RepID=UPI0036670C4C
MSDPPRRGTAHPHRTVAMMFQGNAKAKQIKGKVKESVGKALGDTSVQRAGRREQLRGKAQEMTEKATARVRQWTKH